MIFIGGMLTGMFITIIVIALVNGAKCCEKIIDE